MLEAFTLDLTDYTLASMYMVALTFSVSATMMVRFATFPVLQGASHAPRLANAVRGHLQAQGSGAPVRFRDG